MTASCPTTIPGPTAVLAVEDLRVLHRPATGPAVTALDGVTLSLRAGRALAVVGESGGGKSTLATAILGLLPRGSTATGRVRILGTDVLGAPRRTLRDLRGRVVGLVGQHGASAFDPLFPVGFQLDEAVRAHARMAAPERRERVRESLARAGLALGPGALAAPPGRLSGGMVQRAQVAAAILHHPPLLIADEPTAALDTVRRRGLAALLADLKAGGTAILLVTHDLGLAAAVADEIVVLHGGRIVDRGDPARVLAAPADPATTALVAAWRAVDGSGQPPWTGEGGAR